MGFWNKLGKIATAPARQLHKVNKGILAGNKQLLKGNIGGAFKTHVRSAIDAGNLTGSPQLNKFNDRLGRRIGMAPPPLVGALAAKPQFGGPPPGAPMPPPGPPAQGVVGGAPQQWAPPPPPPPMPQPQPQAWQPPPPPQPMPQPQPQPQPPLNAALMGQAQRRGPRRFPQEYEY